MVDDNIDTIGKAFMGLTLGCARCHDHKFDPVSHHDYYALAGVFYSTRILKELGAKGGNYTLNRVPLAEKEYVGKRDEQVRLLNELKVKLAEVDKKSPKSADDDAERLSLVSQRDKLQTELHPEYPTAEAAAEGGTPGSLFPGIQDVPIHIRGSYTRLGPIVARRMPAFFASEKQPPIASGSGRREVAAWVASKENPLTARVIVNRVWQWHFGAGLVRTPNNFGLLSEPPSHPELLDWLAARFVEEGWSLKKLHRRIVLSASYRQRVRDRETGRGGDRETKAMKSIPLLPISVPPPLPLSPSLPIPTIGGLDVSPRAAWRPKRYVMQFCSSTGSSIPPPVDRQAKSRDHTPVAVRADGALGSEQLFHAVRCGQSRCIR